MSAGVLIMDNSHGCNTEIANMDNSHSRTTDKTKHYWPGAWLLGSMVAVGRSGEAEEWVWQSRKGGEKDRAWRVR